MLFNKKVANSVHLFDNDLKDSHDEEAHVLTKVYINTNVPFGYHKREPEISLKIVNQHVIENYGQGNDLQRKFEFERIYEDRFRHSAFFSATAKPLVNSAFDKGLQHSIIFYEHESLDYFTDFLGIKRKKPINECQLFHTLKYALELSEFKSDLKTAVQVSLVALKNDEAIDLFNQGKPVESPLGYTLETTDHIEGFLDYSRNLLETFTGLDHLCVSIYYQNKKILPGDQVEVQFMCSHGLTFYRQGMLACTSYCLNQDKDRMNESTLDNCVEKMLLHFLSSNYDPDNLPYADLPLSYFLRKYLPFSSCKDIVLFLDVQGEPIETIANDLLYAELCREVAEVPPYEGNEESELSIYESKILQNLSETHEKLKFQFEDLRQKQQNYEESVIKLESASTAGTNPINQIQKFSLNSQYERFLHEMNSKLKMLVQASNDLICDTNAVGKIVSRDNILPPSGIKTRENTVIVKDVNHNYPSIMMRGSERSPGRGRENFNSNLQNSQHLDKTLMGQIETLQRELKANLEAFSDNFELVRQQLRGFHVTSDRKKMENLLPKFLEMKSLVEKHQSTNLGSSSKQVQQAHGRSATIYRENISAKDLDKKNMSCGFEEKKVQTSVIQLDQLRDVSNASVKKEMFGFNEKGLTEIEELGLDRNDLQSGGLTSGRGYLSPRKVVLENKMQEVLGLTWKKIFAFSYKEVNSAMNAVFLNFTKDTPSGVICAQQKSKQKINPSLKQQQQQGGHAKGQIVSTLEEFRTTYERFETAEQNYSLNKMKEELKSFDDEEEYDMDKQRDPLTLRPSQFFANYSIDTIKPIGNKQSFSLPYNMEGPPFCLKIPKAESGFHVDKNFDQTKSNTARYNGLAQSILHKLEALDHEDAKTRVIRRPGFH